MSVFLKWMEAWKKLESQNRDKMCGLGFDISDWEKLLKDANTVCAAEGTAQGDDKCLVAMKQVLSRLLPDGKVPATGKFLVNFCGDVSLMEVNDAVSYLKGLSESEVEICVRSIGDDEQNEQDTVSVLVVMAQGK
jgi:cell division GTPase FtsZ